MNPLLWIIIGLLALGIGYKLFKELAYVKYKMESEGDVSRQDYKDNNLKDLVLQDC